MNYANPDALVSGEWLAERLGKPGIAIIDATWFPKHSPRKAAIEFEQAHIPGAVFFNIDDIADRKTSLPHMLPDAATFAAKVGALGIGDADRVIAYDANGGAAAAARAWWMFRVFGHANIAMLDGGLPKWLKENRPTEGGPARPAGKRFTVRTADGRPDLALVRSAGQLLDNLKTGAEQVVDARSPGRFAGTDPEPWPVKKLGHIPGSRNLPFGRLMDPERANAMRPAGEIAEMVAAAGIDPDRPIVSSCGSGVTAAVVTLGLYLIGHKRAAIYDGSWSEWGARDDTPAEN
ncbi:sulfurtransferase [Shumkonia mesophila]|uniref:sulfurtransferase n=1 Tax=Shumkonia mesophila TaxID=2838854 RepID=UPI002934949F|nr:sulfurtransferase [Shumkonia mesophila]